MDAYWRAANYLGVAGSSGAAFRVAGWEPSADGAFLLNWGEKALHCAGLPVDQLSRESTICRVRSARARYRRPASVYDVYRSHRRRGYGAGRDAWKAIGRT